MSLDAFIRRSSEAEPRDIEFRMVGTGAAVPTKLLGKGITLARPALGRTTLTFREAPGSYDGVVGLAIEAATPANVAGHTIVVIPYNITTRVIEIQFFDAANALHDLAANEFVNVTFRFRATRA